MIPPMDRLLAPAFLASRCSARGSLWRLSSTGRLLLVDERHETCQILIRIRLRRGRPRSAPGRRWRRGRRGRRLGGRRCLGRCCCTRCWTHLLGVAANTLGCCLTRLGGRRPLGRSRSGRPRGGRLGRACRRYERTPLVLDRVREPDSLLVPCTLLDTRNQLAEADVVFKVVKLNRQPLEQLEQRHQNLLPVLALVLDVGLARRRRVAEPVRQDLTRAQVRRECCQEIGGAKLEHPFHHQPALGRRGAPCRILTTDAREQRDQCTRRLRRIARNQGLGQNGSDALAQICRVGSGKEMRTGRRRRGSRSGQLCRIRRGHRWAHYRRCRSPGVPRLCTVGRGPFILGYRRSSVLGMRRTATRVRRLGL